MTSSSHLLSLLNHKKNLLALNTVQSNNVNPVTFCHKTFYCWYLCDCTCPCVSNTQVKEYARAIHLVTFHCIIFFQSLEECYLMSNWTIVVSFAEIISIACTIAMNSGISSEEILKGIWKQNQTYFKHLDTDSMNHQTFK